MSSPKLPYTIQLASGGVLAIAPIEEFGAAPEGVSQKRHCERLSWHTLARQILEDPSAKFNYNSLGAPIIEGSELKISVSHSSSLVAVIISPEPCAVDIESLERNFERVARRYITPAEATLSSSERLSAQLWSIKEAMYKYAGRKEISLLDDLRVLSIVEESFEAMIQPNNQRVSGCVEQLFGHTVAYIF